ncbi:hypothetical protein GVN16_08300 [Emticicia sp. CRIBPO]|uniref:hypothetical protein n=1 Tax=Emticicia sp. CRIBPO TaxID=2683258 RepID=UPI001413659C|nr:hypothetical protein [Emticicia sp. CRIBPO]NBA85756.1 hypothetical protein [Emticicia sp. CRIBPO]
MKNPGIKLLAIACTLISGCQPNYYIPNTQNVPLLTSKGETSLTLSGNTNQVEFLGAYAAGNHFGIQLNGGLIKPFNQNKEAGGSGKLIEAGLGYFKEMENNLVFETYGLFGLGSVENHFPSSKSSATTDQETISAGLRRFGVQPVLGFKTKYFQIAGSARLVNLSYYNISGNHVYENELQTTYLEKNRSSFLIEPAVTVKGGVENVKFQFQLASSANTTNSDFRQDNFLLTLGLNFNFK